MSRMDEPQDKFHFVTIIFLILGLGTLLPWNFFITAIPYFHYQLSGNNATLPNNGTAPQRDEFNFNNWMTLLAQLPLLLCTLLNSFIYQWIPERVRIAGSMTAILSLFIFTAVLVKVNMSPQRFFDLTMATIWFINAFCAILQGSLFGLLTLFPQRYSSMFLSGQGMAGTFAALAMLLSMSSGADHGTTALGYFITPCVGTFISIVCYFLLYRVDFAKHYLSKSTANSAKTYELETKTELLHQGEENGDAAGQKKAVLLLKEAEAGGVGEEKQTVSVCTVLRKIWVMALTIVITFGVTLSVFPAITAGVATSVDSEGWRDFYSWCAWFEFSILWTGLGVVLQQKSCGPVLTVNTYHYLQQAALYLSPSLCSVTFLTTFISTPFSTMMPGSSSS
ncbi:hypothetical protein GDO81_016152 [Engystomops pustulosus]|uniref:Solute carrier family 29 member 2 n=3 Tax=Engystomops pustulosus TaxID=76066 RepID=A0AAV7AUL3_ENGPU|nr:hypothetical protein GDO81_016152 [Engystomops pustulosus]